MSLGRLRTDLVAYHLTRRLALPCGLAVLSSDGRQSVGASNRSAASAMSAFFMPAIRSAALLLTHRGPDAEAALSNPR